MIRAFSWTSHLSEQRLFDCYLAERTGEGVDPRAAEHMADCPHCHDQYIALVGTMDEVWTAGDRETAAVFSPEFLRNQREAIARRLELVEHPGRVITFPAAESPAQAKPVHGAAVTRVAAGWIAAAAAVGLFVGAGAGFLYENRTHVPPAPPAVAAEPPEPATAAPVTARAEEMPEAQSEDERAMAEIEASHEWPLTPELLAFDTLTPHVRDVSLRVR